ncbi:hypothetical protein RRG08_028505 [Elysia crispata]|uniref:Uncharacterized protein n=1 Tax=Elysia crispata TaxID=231223 RepID=A0AAE0ZI16_9GAST|nr:hypothetical protein RRG08_028505 [Elysia crispata]
MGGGKEGLNQIASCWPRGVCLLGAGTTIILVRHLYGSGIEHIRAKKTDHWPQVGFTSSVIRQHATLRAISCAICS